MAAKPRTLDTTVEARVCCEAPVATRLHRALAAVADLSMILIGYGLFLLVFSLSGGQFALNKTTLPVFAVMLGVTAFSYGLVWALAGGETAGMRWMRLRLITFDGFPPDLRQRLLRFGGSCLSMCTMLGLRWSLADEETLTWQDHISSTFPTPVESGTQVFQRR
ncbi:MAG: RDD family protein [Acidobacteriia bacterium]|nr:RDD family protein [Terriglobia bacterium]